MITRRRYKLPLYGVPYDVYVVDTVDEARGIYPEYDEGYAAMVTYEDDYSQLRMIFRSGALSPAVTAHECVHLANRVCVLLGIKADAENDEPLAYMVQYIYGTAESAQRAHKVGKIKNI